MDTSIFMDKSIKPSDTDLKSALGKNYSFWCLISEYVYSQYSNSVSEWKYPGAKYGWSFRIKDKKRVIVYLLPRKGFFKAAFMFGQKASDEIIKSNVSNEIKEELRNARVYAEGRGIRIDVKSKVAIKDIKLLINIKLLN